MAITTLDGLIASAKQRVPIKKTASRTAVANGWFSTIDLAGDPGAGVLAGTSTTAGVVPDDTTAGMPLVNTFGGGANGHVINVEYSSVVASRIMLYDLLFKAGAYAFTGATTALTGQPSYAGRVPAGTDFTNTEIWIEVSTAFVTGTAWQVQVTYTNQSGTTGRTSIILPAAAAAALPQGRMYQIALQAGDTGVQKIESVIVTNGGTAMTAGAFNVLVIRPLWTGRVPLANFSDMHDYLRVGMPRVFDTSALQICINPDSTATGASVELMLTVANG